MKINKNVILFLVCGIVVLSEISSCSKSTPAPLTPTISAITPLTDTIGQTITITGTNFIPSSSVTINNIVANNITVNGTTQITCTVPQIPSISFNVGVGVVVTAGTLYSTSGGVITIEPSVLNP